MLAVKPATIDTALKCIYEVFALLSIVLRYLYTYVTCKAGPGDVTAFFFDFASFYVMCLLTEL